MAQPLEWVRAEGLQFVGNRRAKPRPLHGLTDSEGPEFHDRHAFEGAAESSDGGSDRTYDDNLFHGALSPFIQNIWDVSLVVLRE